ncbi:MAG: M1 family metallopeptidase, partial [Candidatus Eremiobacteraeota bacterium]|nr:M1 family metallopeptidase [Candidatus Eremiobacteraeota bacterium]
MTRLAGCLLAAIAFLFTPPGARAETHVARLTDDVVPLAYDLAIAPNIARSTSAGSETIDVRLRRPLDAIALNALKIGVTRATIDGRVARIETFPAVEQILLRTGDRLGAGPHRIELAFTSAIHGGDDPRGLYASESSYIVTRFEPSTARSMFPCFDEPQFRARFTLHVRAPAAWTVISNMPLRARRPAGAGLTDSDFAPTPPMPAYLLTLDGGVFAHADAVAGTIPIRVFVRPGQVAHARVMAARAQRIVPFYERFFGVAFPLPKLDLVVSPGALGSALEGWGAITFYAEGDVFGRQFGGGERGDRYAAEVLAHEIAHQWVGDLVTMRWWSDTFVAEAVAQFAQRQAVRAVFPELGSWRDDDRAVGDVMRGGVRKGSRPVVHVVSTDLDAEDFQAFDQATYDKGAAVIEGWHDAAGDEQFHTALHEYLTRFAYGSATFDDFWGALGGALGVAYGNSWLLQRGYPIVDVRTACDAGRTTVTLAQTPFVVDAQVEPQFRAQRWIVPVTLRSGANVRRLMLSGAGQVETMPGCEPLVVDPGARPYYLVRYDAPRYRELAAQVARMGERERGIVYRDATSLHAAGELGDTEYVRLLAVAAEPMDVDVWDDVAREYARLDDLVRGVPEASVLYTMEVRVLFPYADRYARLARP